MVNIEQLIQFIELLESNDVTYALVGGAALMTMDSCVRPTDDFGFIVARDDIDAIQELTKESGDRNFGRYLYKGTRIDALYPNNPVFSHVINHYLEPTEIADKTINRSSPEGIILLKLYALPSLYQQGEHRRAMTYENDISGLLVQEPNADISRIFRVLEAKATYSPVSFKNYAT